MKQFFTLAVGFLFTTSLFAQQGNREFPRISASTLQYLWLTKHSPKGPEGSLPGYVYHKMADQQLYVNAFIQVFPQFNEEDLKALGAVTGTRAGSIRTVRIPWDKVGEVLRLPGLRAVDMDQPCFPELDSARRRMRVDSIHQGLGLPRAFAGDSVVMGIIDAGFDYTHPAFYDSTYQRYRVRKVWEQKGSGNSPSGFGYGAEYADSVSIHTRAYDITESTHGTHVGGIAAGSGFHPGMPGSNRFRGIAYRSDLVFVGIYPTPAYWLNTGMADMLDGIQYTFQYAASLGRPAVANLSWGCPLGPRDGSSLFSQACDNITGPGKIFVVSGGNNGQNRIHIKKSFTPADTLLNTFTTFSSALNPKINQIDVWGDSGKPFKMQFSLYDGSSKVAQSAWVSLDNQTHSIQLVGSNFDTLFVLVTSVPTEFNGKPHMLVQMNSRVGDRVGISVAARGGVVHLWQGVVVKTSGYYGNFTRYTFNWANDGDVAYTCGDLVSTRSALAVAAYNTKTSFTNVDGSALSYTGYVRGRIAAFSSLGPTADGRVRPDIAAPGMALASSVSSYDPDNQPGGADYSAVVSVFTSPRNNRTYAFGMAGGTSMAAPCVSGLTALLLQINPTLDPAGLKTLLSQTAIRDANTGVIPDGGSTTWGAGKVNGMRALKTLLQPTGVVHSESASGIMVYPNPGNGIFRMESLHSTPAPMQVRVMDPLGKVILELTGSQPVQELDLSPFPDGLYGIQVQGRDGNSFVRVLKR